MLEAQSMSGAQLSSKDKNHARRAERGRGPVGKRTAAASLSASRTQYDDLTARVERLEEQIALALQGI
jgi:hypothetical protein